MNEELRMEEDEIDLIDLLVVLLKYRRLILGITIGALLLAVVGYFWYPDYQYNQALGNSEGEIYQAYMNVGMMPVVNKLNGRCDLNQQFQQVPNLLNALRSAGYESFSFSDNLEVNLESPDEKSRALFLIQQRLVKNQNIEGDSLSDEKRIFAVKNQRTGVTVWYKDHNAEKAEAFLDALFTQANESVINTLRPLAKAEIESYEDLMEIEDPPVWIETVLNEDREKYEQAQLLLEGETEALHKLSSVYTVTPQFTLDSYQDSYKIKGIVLVIAALFFSIFLAFVLNALSNVRSDEDSMKKVRKALGKE